MVSLRRYLNVLIAFKIFIQTFPVFLSLRLLFNSEIVAFFFLIIGNEKIIPTRPPIKKIEINNRDIGHFTVQ